MTTGAVWRYGWPASACSRRGDQRAVRGRAAAQPRLHLQPVRADRAGRGHAESLLASVVLGLARCKYRPVYAVSDAARSRGPPPSGVNVRSHVHR